MDGHHGRIMVVQKLVVMALRENPEHVPIQLPNMVAASVQDHIIQQNDVTRDVVQVK